MKCLVVDDELLLREGICAVVQRCWPKATLLVAATYDEARFRLEKGDLDLALIDLSLGCENSGMALLSLCATLACPPRTVVVSATEDMDTVRECFRLGATSYIVKRTADFASFKSAVEEVMSGSIHIPPATLAALQKTIPTDGRSVLIDRLRQLPPRRFAVAELIATGASNKQIGKALGIVESSVKAHVSMLFLDFEVRTRLEFMALLSINGVRPPLLGESAS